MPTASLPADRPAAPAPELLVERHYAAVYNLAYRTLGRREDAEDVAQQTFVRALPRLGELRDPAAAAGWLCRIAANLCTDELRRRGRDRSVAPADGEDSEDFWDGLPDPAPAGAPAAAAERGELRLAVWRAALSLPPPQRLALALRELHGMSYAEIAAAMRTSVAAVEALLFRARQGFRRAYEGAEASPSVDASREAACEWVLRRLSASIDGELGAEEQARLEAHVTDCGTCRFAARELRATSRIYALVPLLSPPAEAQAGVLAVVSAGAGTGVSLVGGLAASVGAAKLGALAAAAIATLSAGAVWAAVALDRAVDRPPPPRAHVVPTELPILALAALTPAPTATPAPAGPSPTGRALPAPSPSPPVPSATPTATLTPTPTTAATASPTSPPATATPTVRPLPRPTRPPAVAPLPPIRAEAVPTDEATDDQPMDGSAGDRPTDAPAPEAAWAAGEATPAPSVEPTVQPTTAPAPTAPPPTIAAIPPTATPRPAAPTPTVAPPPTVGARATATPAPTPAPPTATPRPAPPPTSPPAPPPPSAPAPGSGG